MFIDKVRCVEALKERKEVCVQRFGLGGGVEGSYMQRQGMRKG